MVTRRRMLTTGLSTAAAVSGTAVALRPMLTAGSPADGKAAGRAAGKDGVPGDHDAPLFDEIYRGRRIQGFRTASESGVALFVDGRPLHVMRRVDGSWISMANHFQPFLTPLATARGAVDVIGHAPLTDGTERVAHDDH
ncbi:tyrosinase family oxidase copper chaperone [Streptomyces sp. V4-01]|uniref:Tyrosinase family oxidase copper chaperone n=1 Tax=Actinacidiphila polyblastidii TaxID=3110430 RepID=A0ABU7P603_9ACTN|nr:tyrosinase family oxidase copper chaperone [Streptomyces sp. V4-01]